MRNLTRTQALIALLTVYTLTVPVSATSSECGGDAGEIAAHIFDMSDSNEDGFLSPNEFEEAGLARYGVLFEEFDRNEDGETSVDEFFDLFEMHHPPREVI